MINKLNNHTFDILSCCDENCICGEGKFNEKVYGCQIPYVYHIFIKVKSIIEIVISNLEKEKNDLTINKLIFMIITQISVLKPIEDDEIEKFIDSLSTIYDYTNLSKLHLSQLIKDIVNCFHFEYPDLPIVQNMWIHHSVISTIAEPIPKIPTSDEPKLFTEEVEDEDIFLHRYQIDDKYFRKKIIMETAKEKKKIYPSVKHVHDYYEICIDKFDSIFKQSKLDISKLIAKYKTTC